MRWHAVAVAFVALAMLHMSSSAAHAHDLVEPGVASLSLSGGAVTGGRQLLVVRAAFTGRPADTASRETLLDAVFAGPGSVAAYYREVSSGRLSLGGDVTPLLQIDADPDVCNFRAWQAATERAAEDAGIDLMAYDHVAFVFPWSPDCRSGAYAELGGRYTWYFSSFPSADYASRVFAHELGHNFGFNHANAWQCSYSDGEPAQVSEACTSVEYGDPFDVMGGMQRLRHVNGYLKARAGWIDNDELADLDSNAEVALAPVNRARAGGPRLARVVRDRSAADAARELLFVEYRTAEGFDDAAVAGVHVRVARADATASDRSQLIDAVPETAAMLDAALPAGGVLYDSGAGLTVRVLQVSDLGASVAIEYGFDVTPPRPASNVRAEQQSSHVVRVCWEAAVDDRALLRYELERDGELIGRVRAAATCYDDAAAEPGAVHAYRVIAVDRALNRAPSDQAIVAVLVLPATPPPPPLPPTWGIEQEIDESAGTATWLVEETGAATDAFVDGFLEWAGGELP